MNIVCTIAVESTDNKYAVAVDVGKKLAARGYVTAIRPYANTDDTTQLYLIVKSALTIDELAAIIGISVASMQYIDDAEQYLACHPELVSVTDADTSAVTVTYIIDR